MNIREAILKAAKYIQANPKDFDFGSTTIPHGCGTPGCALGWIGHFLGASTSIYCHIGIGNKFGRPIAEVLGHGRSCDFYGVLQKYEKDWSSNADACARAMRLYADKYHPAVAPIAEDRQLVPWSSVAFKPAMLRV